MTLTTKSLEPATERPINRWSVFHEDVEACQHGNYVLFEDHLKSIESAYAAGRDIARREIAEYLRTRTGALSMEGIRKFADYLESQK